jgi:hypothetical protein
MRYFSMLLTATLLACASCKQCPDICANGGFCANGGCQCQYPWTGPTCETNSCGNIICHHQGICAYGVCNCVGGYEGKACDTLITYKFAGSFNDTSSCCTRDTVNISISGSPTAQNVTITALCGVGVVAFINRDSLIIQKQLTFSNDQISGAGIISPNHDTVYITTTFYPIGGNTYNCSYVLSRR